MSTEFPLSESAVPPAAARYGDYAGSITRLVAFVMDGLIIATCIGVVSFVITFMGDFLHVRDFTQSLLQVVTIIVAFSMHIGYYVLFWSLAGMTIGKRFMGVLIVAKDGGRVTFGMAVRRYIGYFVSALFMLGYIWIVFDPRRQGWHDKLAGTFVIYNWPDEVLLAVAVDAESPTPTPALLRRQRLAALTGAQAPQPTDAPSTALVTRG